MGYTGTLFVLLPHTVLLMAVILLVISFAVIYSMKGVLKLRKEEIANEKGTLMPLTFVVWGINTGVLAASFVIMDFNYLAQPVFQHYTQ